MWVDYAIGRGVPPFDACELVLDVSESLNEQNLHAADDLFRAAVEKYLSGVSTN
jgi:hypothetical protein